MRSLTEHRDHLLADLTPPPVRLVPVGESLGLVLAADVVAVVDLPGFDNSAMDGYAVRAADLVGASAASPVSLPVDGDIAAGDTTRHTLAPGRTMRIMTGAPMPDGADAVVPVEASDGGTETVELAQAPEVGRHLRSRGEDVRAGSVVLRAGQRIGPGQLALAAAANVAEVSVHPRPRVAIFSTGDELRAVGSELSFGQIVDSNGAMLGALVRAADAELVGLGHLDDNAEAVGVLLGPLPGSPDLVLTTGGVSMGAYDTVKEVLSGGGVEFVKVAMRPGMPQGSGRVGPDRTPIITLPGNPVSSLVSFHVFVLPALRRLAGLDPLADGAFVAVAAVDWPSMGGRVDCTRVVVAPDGLRPSGGQGSHQLGAMAKATALALVPAEVDRVTAGLVLTCLPLLGTMGA
ncbi:MAG: gephyrin-like molybdotransferase Glp [Nostocoides sp.]